MRRLQTIRLIMATQICSCEGLNPQCEKCFGSGYTDAAASKKSAAAGNKTAEKAGAKQASLLPEGFKSLPRKEVETVLAKIVDSLDLKSKKQMQLLNSIPFNSTTFRRDFKGKFESLRKLESEKRFLRGELDSISKEMAEKKYANHFKFGHFLSDKDVDVDSNRQLKTLMREYKKIKDKPGS